MAPTGLEIYKLLPKTNCKECGFPTCLAFAMKLAQKGTELDNCPYVSDEAKAALRLSVRALRASMTAAAREAAKVRTEGKDYVVHDGDVIIFLHG